MKEPTSMIARALPLLGLGLILAVATAIPAQAQTSSHSYTWTTAGEPAAAPAPPEAPQAPTTPRTPPVPPVTSAPAAPAAPASPSAAIAQAPAAPAAPPAPPRNAARLAPLGHLAPEGQMINVKIDVVLSDSTGGSKTLSMTVADGASAMNRTTTTTGDFMTVADGAGAINRTTNATGDFSFNADVLPVVSGSRIRLRLTADALVPPAADQKSGRSLALRQSQTIILNDGESVEIARAADPVSDRSFTLTVKAKILR